MINYLYRSVQGAVFVIVMWCLNATPAEAALAFMVGVSFDPRHFVPFL